MALFFYLLKILHRHDPLSDAQSGSFPSAALFRRASPDENRRDLLVHRLGRKFRLPLFSLFHLLNEELHGRMRNHIDLLAHGRDRDDRLAGDRRVIETDELVAVW